MKVLNMTPHPVTIYFINPNTGEEERIVNIPPSGEVLRLAEVDIAEEEVVLDIEGEGQVVVPLKVRTFDHEALMNRLSQFEVEGGVALVVSSMIIQQLPEQFQDALRKKGILLIAPDSGTGAIRDTQGRLLGVKGFIRGGSAQ